MTRRELARALADLSEFSDPDPDREQYPTPADLAAQLVHLADLRGDLDRRVVDLGTGTGILAIGAALRGAQVVGLDFDASALAIARANAREAGVAGQVEWVRGTATDAGLCAEGTTVVMNPPFGAQRASVGDRPFLETAARIAGVSYSIHNEGSRAFVEAFADDHGGRVAEGFRADLELDRRFEFQETDSRTLAAECFRIEWG